MGPLQPCNPWNLCNTGHPWNFWSLWNLCNLNLWNLWNLVTFGTFRTFFVFYVSSRISLHTKFRTCIPSYMTIYSLQFRLSLQTHTPPNLLNYSFRSLRQMKLQPLVETMLCATTFYTFLSCLMATVQGPLRLHPSPADIVLSGKEYNEYKPLNVNVVNLWNHLNPWHP